MIADTAGHDIEIIRESELGIYDTMRVAATYCIRRDDGSHYIRTKDGMVYETSPRTIINEFPAPACR